MIGNDIVDLKQAAKDSNWQRPRFLAKVFTIKEQDYIFSSENKHQVVWLLWSMKEAAYKVNVQQFGKQFFNPIRLECNLISLEKGRVEIDAETYYTTSQISNRYIYTVATQTENTQYESHCFQVENNDYKSQSQSLKQQFLRTIVKSETYNFKCLNIKKNEIGVPQVFNNSVMLPISFSLTHCGSYSAFSIFTKTS